MKHLRKDMPVIVQANVQARKSDDAASLAAGEGPVVLGTGFRWQCSLKKEIKLICTMDQSFTSAANIPEAENAVGMCLGLRQGAMIA